MYMYTCASLPRCVYINIHVSVHAWTCIFCTIYMSIIHVHVLIDTHLEQGWPLDQMNKMQNSAKRGSNGPTGIHTCIHKQVLTDQKFNA